MKLLNKKAFRDLFGKSSRIFTVLIAMIVGTTIFVTITFTREVINRELDVEYNAMVPASASILVDRADEPLLEMLKEQKSIAGFEVGAAYEMLMTRPDGTKKTLKLFSALDYAERKINIIFPVEGSFIPSEGEVLLDSDALSVAGAKLGDTIVISLPDGKTKEYVIA